MESFLRPSSKPSFSEGFIRSKGGLSFQGFVNKIPDKKKKIHNTIDANHIAAWWFEESGSSIIDQKGTYTGTATGTTTIQGYVGNARHGAGGTDKIAFASTIIPLGQKTVMCKIRRASHPSGNEQVLGNFTSSKGDAFILNTDGTISYYIDGGNVGNVSSIIDVCDGNWHDIRFTWDGLSGTNKLTLKVDGSTTQATASTTQTSTPDNNLVLFMRNSGIIPFIGDLDEIEISNIVR